MDLRRWDLTIGQTLVGKVRMGYRLAQVEALFNPPITHNARIQTNNENIIRFAGRSRMFSKSVPSIGFYVAQKRKE